MAEALLEPVSGISPKKPAIEEVCFESALLCLEGHFTNSPPMGPLTGGKVVKVVNKTLDRTHQYKDIRETLSRNVEVWLWFCLIFASAVPSLTARSVGPLHDPDRGNDPAESAALIIKNYPSLKEDLHILNKLMLVARNLLVTSEPEVPQDICAGVHFDQMVFQTLILCVNVTSKAYNADAYDETSRIRLNEIVEAYKKLLVTSLQQIHNWTAKNDRNKMAFWLEVLFDEEDIEAPRIDDLSGIRVDVARRQTEHWWQRNWRLCPEASCLLTEYARSKAHKPPGELPIFEPLSYNWLPADIVKHKNPADESKEPETREPRLWKEEISDDAERDRVYRRVSWEIDRWWRHARDGNYAGWNVPMATVQVAQAKTDQAKAHRFAMVRDDDDPLDEPSPLNSQAAEAVEEDVEIEDEPVEDEGTEEGHQSIRSFVQEYVDEMDEEDDDLQDDDEYDDGPVTGVLTEVPNILEPKHIEALHMIIKSCILDTVGSGLTRYGENLQRTRCCMMLATDTGKSLIREILVFIAVWDLREDTIIFQLTAQIVEALHHKALIPYTWNGLKIPKDIISPGQTVLLRLMGHIIRARNGGNTKPSPDEVLRDAQACHYLFNFFRVRVVPECVALMELQAHMRQAEENHPDENILEAADFPVDTWDMERAKDGLLQYLNFLTILSDIPQLREYLIQWEATYDLITLLKGLEIGAPKKPLVEMPTRANNPPAPTPSDPLVERPYSTDYQPCAHQPTPPIAEAHHFPWADVKVHILSIIAALLQPTSGSSGPGNPAVQEQILAHNGIVSLLNCCVYDDYQRFARERVHLCLKWLMDGSPGANEFLRNLVSSTPPPDLSPGKRAALKVDGIGGTVKVEVQARPNSAPPKAPSASSPVTNPAPRPSLRGGVSTATPNFVKGPTLPPITLPPIAVPGNTTLPSAATLSTVASVAEYTRREQAVLDQFIQRMDDEFKSECDRLAAAATVNGGGVEGGAAAAAAAAQTAIMKDIWNLAGEAARLALEQAAEDSMKDANVDPSGSSGSGDGSNSSSSSRATANGNGNNNEGGKTRLEVDFM
ncbi:copper transport 86 [Zalerion maritima]|uniref:Ataxin-10 homolog n=1 Tax=Zalerion maritima TaxID=339359 RepID=A0AAD5RX71_9PEZI|nr:copper transport 86 [Zalerion maritima]